MNFGGNTNFNILISCGSSFEDEFQDRIDVNINISRQKRDEEENEDEDEDEPTHMKQFEIQDALMMLAQDKVRTMGEEINTVMDDMDARFEANTELLVENARKDVDYLKEAYYHNI